MTRPLECPDCGAKVAWNGDQFVCAACPWTEHKAKPPSERKIEVPRRDEQKPSE